MSPVIYHTGLTAPPISRLGDYTVIHSPTIAVEFIAQNEPAEITEFLRLPAITLIMSKNAVTGLQKWLQKFQLDSDYFKNTEFWTVGNRSHITLKEQLLISSWYPEEMTGKGILQALNAQKTPRVLLISAREPREDFIKGLITTGINFFHFPVYRTAINKNEEIFSRFEDAAANYLVVTSPSSARGVLQNLSIPDLKPLEVKFISIGPTTSEEIRKLGGEIFYESEIQDISFLYEKLEEIISCHEQS